ncbi:MAG: membrane protein insertion efficiency factor YidD [Bacteroidales bacterium]|nr:membrane protein insertion efficiency factor YidD [Bacteroidales bacterium]
MINNCLNAQTSEDLALFSDLYKVHQHNTNYGKYFKNTSNELELVSTGLFVFYKDFFSSQDGNHCVFYPSCSIYAIEAVKKQGIILGLMNGVDRLSRCNRLSPENYSFYKNTLLFYDPVE